MAGPVKRFSTGGIVVAVWKNRGTSTQGEETTFQTVSLERRYKDKDGQWQSTGSLRANDVPKASLLLGKAYEYLVMKTEGQ